MRAFLVYATGHSGFKVYKPVFAPSGEAAVNQTRAMVFEKSPKDDLDFYGKDSWGYYQLAA